MPEVEQQLYYDFTANQERLLKQTLNTYSQHGYIIRQDIYDADLQYCYSLHTEYDPAGRPLRKTDALGQQTRFQYDPNGNLISQLGPNPDHQILNHYDPAYRLIKTEKKDAHGHVITEQYRYDLLSRRTATIDECGNETKFEYDELGRLVKQIYPPIKGQSACTSQQYDVAGNILSQTDERGFTTTRKYNFRKQPIDVRYPDGTFETFEYALNGFLAKSRSRTGLVTHFERDYQGRPTKESLFSASGELLATMQKEYALDKLIRETDAEGRVTTFEYDGAGRLIAVRKGDSLVTYAYDSLGRQQEIREYQEAAKYVLKTFKYDYLDRVIEEAVGDQEGNISVLKR